jgi:hypothetical protein
MKMMETTAKVVAEKALDGFMRTIAALRLKLIMSPQNALPSEIFKYGVPYEASRTYRAMKAEFERKKCMVAVEAYHQMLRSI